MGESSKGELVRSSSRSQLNRAASQSYLRNYSPVPMDEEFKGSDSRRGSRCAGNHNTTSEQRGGALWNSMQGKEVKREDSKLARQESRNGGIQRQDSQRGLQRQDSRTGSLQRQDSRLQRQDSRSNGMKFSPKEREPYQGSNNWKDSLRGASPTKPVWERSTASSRAKQSNGEAYVPRKTSTARNNSNARRSRSDSVTRRSRSQSGSPDRLMRPTYSSRAKGRRASRNSMGSPPRSRTSSVSPSRAQSSSNRAQSSSPSRRPSRRASTSETPFTGGSTVRGKPGDGGNPLDKYVPFDKFRANRSSQDSGNYSAKASSSSYTAAASSYSAIRNDARSGGGGTSPIRSPTRSSTSPIRLPSSSPARRPSSSPIRNPSDSAWRNSTSSNYAKLSASSSTSNSWQQQSKTSSSSFSASRAIDSSDSYSFSSKAADSSYGSWGRNSTGRGTSTSPKSSFSSRSPGGSSGRIGLSALKKPVIEPWEDERKDSSSSARRGVSSTYIG